VAKDPPAANEPERAEPFQVRRPAGLGEREFRLLQERAARASGSRTPRWALKRLAKNPDPEVRIRAAANPLTPKTALLALLQDPDPLARAKAALNPRIIQSELWRLEGDCSAEEILICAVCGQDSRRRLMAAREARTPAWLLRFLCSDPGGRVRDAAAQRLALALARKAKAAGGPTGPPAPRAREAAKVPGVRPKAAESSGGLEAALAGDADREVLRAVAKNDAAPPGALLKLARGRDHLAALAL
jgi:hypothetical protein